MPDLMDLIVRLSFCEPPPKACLNVCKAASAKVDAAHDARALVPAGALELPGGEPRQKIFPAFPHCDSLEQPDLHPIPTPEIFGVTSPASKVGFLPALDARHAVSAVRPAPGPSCGSFDPTCTEQQPGSFSQHVAAARRRRHRRPGVPPARGQLRHWAGRP